MKLKREFLRLYIIPIVLLAGIVLTTVFTIIFTTTTTLPDGSVIDCNQPKDFTIAFAQYITVQYASDNSDGTSSVEESISVTEEGTKLLAANDLWLQILDPDGNEIYQFNRPDSIPTNYTPQELLVIFQEGTADSSVFLCNLTKEDTTYTYLIGFPIHVSKVVSYVDDARYQAGKYLIVGTIVLTLLLLVLLTIFYYVKISRADRQRLQDEKAKEEWLANITHDLKTPLAPIRGYAELLSENELPEENTIRKYNQTILKNVLYTQELVDDLKLTYQLQSNMMPIEKHDGNLSRFIKELVIDTLNTPEYEGREITFISKPEEIHAEYDEKLMKRAFLNVLVNALKHNPAKTQIEVIMEQDASDTMNCKDKKHVLTTKLIVKDNGSGMTKEQIDGLFTRYYRGTDTETKAEGSGLGMAIAKQIVTAHGGSITAESKVSQGTVITLMF